MITFIQKKLSYTIAASALVFSLESCGSHSSQSGAPATGLQELPVVTIGTGDAKDTLQFTSSIQGINNVSLQPQVTGYLTKIYIDEGQFVKKGQLLFQIDARPYREQLANAQAVLKSAEASLLSSQITVDKQSPLVEKKVVAPINLKQVKANYDAQKAIVEQARAAVQTARINLGYCTIVAPVDGFIGSIPNKLGSLVSPSGSQPLTVLSQIEKVYAYFSMSEDAYMRFQREHSGKTVQDKINNTPFVLLRLSDGSLYEQKGKVQVVEGQFDQNTASIQFRAIFDNPGNILRTGNTGTILMPQSQGTATLVPIASTTDLQDKVYVWKVDNSNKVHQAILEVSGQTGDYYTVLSGINAGDHIVAAGFDRLSENTPIKPTSSK